MTLNEIRRYYRNEIRYYSTGSKDMPYDMAWLVGRERERRTEQQVLKSCTAELLAVMVSHVIE